MDKSKKPSPKDAFPRDLCALERQLCQTLGTTPVLATQGLPPPRPLPHPLEKELQVLDQQLSDIFIQTLEDEDLSRIDGPRELSKSAIPRLIAEVDGRLSSIVKPHLWKAGADPDSIREAFGQMVVPVFQMMGRYLNLVLGGLEAKFRETGDEQWRNYFLLAKNILLVKDYHLGGKKGSILRSLGVASTEKREMVLQALRVAESLRSYLQAVAQGRILGGMPMQPGDAMSSTPRPSEAKSQSKASSSFSQLDLPSGSESLENAPRASPSPPSSTMSLLGVIPTPSSVSSGVVSDRSERTSWDIMSSSSGRSSSEDMPNMGSESPESLHAPESDLIGLEITSSTPENPNQTQETIVEGYEDLPDPSHTSLEGSRFQVAPCVASPVLKEIVAIDNTNGSFVQSLQTLGGQLKVVGPDVPYQVVFPKQPHRGEVIPPTREEFMAFYDQLQFNSHEVIEKLKGLAVKQLS